jgi:hypothetical protein
LCVLSLAFSVLATAFLLFVDALLHFTVGILGAFFDLRDLVVGEVKQLIHQRVTLLLRRDNFMVCVLCFYVLASKAKGF